MSNKIGYKKFIILHSNEGQLDGLKQYLVFTKDEYFYGKGYRTPEFECDSLREAKEAVDCY